MKKLLGILALSLGLLAGQAQADIAKMYYGIGFTDGKMELTNAGDKSLGTVNATLGFQLLDFVGLELEVGAASDQAGSIISEPLSLRSRWLLCIRWSGPSGHRQEFEFNRCRYSDWWRCQLVWQ